MMMIVMQLMLITDNPTPSIRFQLELTLLGIFSSFTKHWVFVTEDRKLKKSAKSVFLGLFPYFRIQIFFDGQTFKLFVWPEEKNSVIVANSKHSVDWIDDIAFIADNTRYYISKHLGIPQALCLATQMALLFTAPRIKDQDPEIKDQDPELPGNSNGFGL